MTLEISWCKELDLSTNDGGGDGEGVSHLQLHGHHKLCHLRIEGIGKMESLPGWFQHLSNLSKLKLSSCPKLDWTGESENQEDNPNLQSFGPTKLQKLKIQDIEKMKTLPWWIQHQTKLESLTLAHCQNLMALPEWFPQLNSLKFLRVYDCSKLSRRCQSNTGEDWPKISHIQRLQIC